jgi:hypothetical protein
MAEPERNRMGLGLWIVLAILAYGSYQLFFVGSPENKKFLDDCHARGTRYLTSRSLDEEFRRVVVDCQHQLREFKKSN